MGAFVATRGKLQGVSRFCVIFMPFHYHHHTKIVIRIYGQLMAGKNNWQKIK